MSEISAEDLRRITAALGLVPVPEHLMERVLKLVRTHRDAIRHFDESGISVKDVVTAQPYRA